MKPNFKLEGVGLNGLPDLGIIRYISSLDPLCQLIDSVITAKDFTVDITAVKLTNEDYAQLGHDLLHTKLDVSMVEECYNDLTEEKKKEVLESIEMIAEEFRHFRFYSYMDEGSSDRALGGPEVVQIYTDMFAMHKAIKREGEAGIVEALSKFILGYAYEWHGESIYELFNESLAYFESNLVSRITSVELVYKVGLIFAPKYIVNIRVENSNG